MTDEIKPREFWFDALDHNEIPERFRHQPGVIHVIEYSAYEALQKELEQAKSEIERWEESV